MREAIKAIASIVYQQKGSTRRFFVENVGSIGRPEKVTDIKSNSNMSRNLSRAIAIGASERQMIANPQETAILDNGHYFVVILQCTDAWTANLLCFRPKLDGLRWTNPKSLFQPSQQNDANIYLKRLQITTILQQFQKLQLDTNSKMQVRNN